jgi:hypothetical protein
VRGQLAASALLNDPTRRERASSTAQRGTAVTSTQAKPDRDDHHVIIHDGINRQPDLKKTATTPT